MRLRFLGIGVVCIITVACVFLAFPEIYNFFGLRERVIGNKEKINLAADRINELETQYITLKGSDVPRTLRNVAAFLSEIDGVEIVRIQSFDIAGDGVRYISNVTSMSYDAKCDGFEIELEVNDFAELMYQVDDSGLTLHSADFLIGAKTAILRVRLGVASLG